MISNVDQMTGGQQRRKITAIELIEAKRMFVETKKHILLFRFDLSERDYDILKQRLVHKKRSSEIAKIYKLSGERVRQICVEAISKMKAIIL